MSQNMDLLNLSKSVDPVTKLNNRLPKLPVANLKDSKNVNDYRSTFYNGDMSTARNTKNNSF